MPYGANGNFTRVMNWTSDYENGIEIVCDRHDAEDDNFAQGFNVAFCRDGRATATGNFKMGGFKITGLGDGTSQNDAVNKHQLDTSVNNAQGTLQTQIDTINTTFGDYAFIGDLKQSLQTANHGCWILCNGQAISRTDYADLYDLIGTTYGDGDGSTTFNVPDYSGAKLPLSSTVDVMGNGNVLGFKTNSAGTWYANGQSVNSESAIGLFQPSGTPNIGDSKSGTNYKQDRFVGIETDATKSGLTGALNAVSMNYFIKAL